MTQLDAEENISEFHKFVTAIVFRDDFVAVRLNKGFVKPEQ